MNDRVKLELTSLDVAQEKRAELKRSLGQAFPEGFAEGLIDFEQLRRVLGDWVDTSKERFGLNWPGKAECMKIIQQPSVATLKPARSESVNFDVSHNLFIEGDNLEVLKLLQKAHFGRVDMIYIDPPYNTGGEFIYPDKYAETLDTYLAYTGQIDAEGRRFATNTDSSGRYHSRWLSMMYPRLYLAKNLLRQDGLIFISIDDHEVAHLRELCDQIFGEENFVSEIVWKKAYGGGAKAKHIVGHHEYVLVYAKNKESIGHIDCPPNPETRKYYKFKDEYFETLGPYRTQPLWTNSMDERENLRYAIVKDVIEIWPEKQWQWEKSRTLAAQRANKLEFVKSDNSYSVYYKQYLYDDDGNERSAKLFSVQDGPYTQSGTDEIEELFGDGKIFPFPKPSSLIEKFVSTLWNRDQAIVMDFFAGSCATAQAVMQFNTKAEKSHSYIMVQLPEPCDESSPAFKAGFRTIAEIGRERLRRAARKLSDAAQGELELRTGKLDVGFKAFRLDRSNFKLWDGSADRFDEGGAQLEMHIDHVSASSSAEDVLYELLLKAGFPLTTEVKSVAMLGKHVFSVQSGALLICLEKEITAELIDALADANPLQVICLDEGFKGNDQLKANAVQTFKARAQAGESEIVFRTV
jgi:adenine-specific DNA-methyltransferase